MKILSLSLLFIFAKSLKNHSKLLKNHKIKILILLDYLRTYNMVYFYKMKNSFF